MKLHVFHYCSLSALIIASFFLFFPTKIFAQSIITKSGPLTSNETWLGTIHITGDVTVSSGVILTIQPGTRVEFAANSDDQNGGDYSSKSELLVSNGGVINANGTGSEPIIFTSASTTPQPGDWGHIKGAANISYAIIEYSMDGFYDPGWDLTIANNIIRNNQNNGLTINGSNSGSGSTIRGNTITNNGGDGIWIGSGFGATIDSNQITNNTGNGITIFSTSWPSVIHNTITGNRSGIVIPNAGASKIKAYIHSNSISGNTSYSIENHQTMDIDASNNDWGTTDKTQIENSILDFNDDPNLGLVAVSNASVSEETHISGNVSWTDTHIITSNLWIDEGSTLTLQAGTQIKLDGFYGIFNHGTLIVTGTSSNPVIFTSNKTNPAPGDWAMIKLNYSTGGFNAPGEKVANINYAQIQYARTGIYAVANLSSVSNSTISNNLIDGITESFNTNVVLDENTITNNGQNGVTGTSSINCSIISGNSTYNYRNIDNPSVDATYNYWGTTDTNAIAQSIYDHYDQSNFGIVDFSNYLSTTPALLGLTAPADQSSTGGVSSTFDLGSFVNCRGESPWSIDVDWGDNSTHTTFTTTSPGAVGSKDHTYVNGGTYTATVNITNKVGDSDSKTFQVTVPGSAATPTPETTPTSTPTPTPNPDLIPTGISPSSGETAVSLTPSFTGAYSGSYSYVEIQVHNVDDPSGEPYGDCAFWKEWGYPPNTLSFTMADLLAHNSCGASKEQAWGHLEAGNQYYYFVKAFDGSIWHQSDNVYFTTAGPTPIPTPTPTPETTPTSTPTPTPTLTRSGIIQTNETWSGIVLITGDVIVPNGVTLTVDPGTTVEFVANSDDQHSGDYQDKSEIIVNGGTFNAAGTSISPILFTSASSSPSPGDWGQIKLINAYGSILTHNNVEFSSNGMYDSHTDLSITDNSVTKSSGNGFTIDGASGQGSIIIGNKFNSNGGIGLNLLSAFSALVDNNQMENNGASGIRIFSTNSPTITHNTITGNGVSGIVIPNAGSSKISANIHQNTISENTNYAIENHQTMDIDATNNQWGTTDPAVIASQLYDFNDDSGLGLIAYSDPLINAETHISGNQTWSGTHVIGSNIWVDSDSTLTIQAGTQIKFNGLYGIFSQGNLSVQGNGDSSVVFTSNKLTQAPGDWGLIKLNGESSKGTINFAQIFYATNGVYAVDNNSSTISNSIVSNSLRDGLVQSFNAYISLDQDSITNNGGNGIVASGNSVTCSTITGNTGYSYKNRDQYNVDATYNYWGTTDQSAIANSIYDHYDQSGLGIVDFSNYLSGSPVKLALVSPSNQTSIEGVSNSFDLGSILGCGAHSPWAVDVDWGDNSNHTNFALTNVGSLGTQPHTYIEEGTYTVLITATENNSNSVTKNFLVTVGNAIPAVGTITVSPTQVQVNGVINASANFSDSGIQDTHTALWDWGDGNTSSGIVTETNGSGTVTNSHTYTTFGTYTIRLTVTDNNGASGTNSKQIFVNDPPVPNAGGPYYIAEGGSMPLQASATDANNDMLTYAWDLDNNGTYEAPGQIVIFSAASLDGPSIKTVGLQVCDDHGACASTTATVNIFNVSPTVGAITAPTGPVMVNTAISTSANFTDPGILDTHTAVWDWGDGNTSTDTVIEQNGSGSIVGLHTYTQAGIYIIQLTVTDKDGGSGTNLFNYIVIYDPNDGFVTGSGTIQSPAGALPLFPTITGRATFGVSAKYTSGSTTPTGTTRFSFPKGGFDFVSASYDWLAVNGSTAYLHGHGTINGAGSYTFLVSEIDGSPDKFRLKITDSSNTVLYDNQMGAPDTALPTQAIVSGQIKIH